MATKQERYRFRNGVTPLDADTFNARFFDVDARLGGLEQVRIDWEAAVRALNDLGLSRLADLLGQINLQAQAALSGQAAVFDAAEADRADTFSDDEAARAASYAAWAQSVNALITGLDALIQEAQSGQTAAAIVALQQWQALLNPIADGVLRPDRIREGAATITYHQDGSVQYLDTALPGGSTYRQAYTYHMDGSVDQVTATVGAVTLWTRTYTYDQAGALTGWTEA